MVPSALCMAAALVALLSPCTLAVTSHSSTEGPSSSSTSVSTTTSLPPTSTKRSVTEELEDTLISGLFTDQDEDALPTLLPTGLMPPRKDVQESEVTWGPPSKPAVTNVGSGFLIIRIIETIHTKEPHSFVPLALKDVTTSLPVTDEDSSSSEEKDEAEEGPKKGDRGVMHLLMNMRQLKEDKDEPQDVQKDVKDDRSVASMLMNIRQLSEDKDEPQDDKNDDLTGANFIHPAFLYSPYAFGRGYSPYYGRPYGGYRPYYRYW